VPDAPRVYTNQQANAQEAHEAIRPTDATVIPDTLKGRIDDKMLQLYDLIWKRTIASQMTNAVSERLTVTLHPAGAAAATPAGIIRANGSTLIKPGYLAAYAVDRNDDEDSDESGGRLPPLAVGDIAKLVALTPEQHTTEPPPRYTEASLVKALEERGIGRPSTYAAIIETLRARKYVEDDRKNFLPTDTGKIVSNFLVRFFPQYVDYEFTAHLEDSLDDISRGDKDWVPVMLEFWQPFIDRVRDIEKTVSREEVAQSRLLGIDPVSGRPVSVRIGQYGPFVQIGTKDDVDKPKFAGLRPGQKMDSIDFDEAMKLFTLPKALGELPGGDKVSVGIGRFGPFVKFGSKYVSIKTDDPYTLEFPRALELIEEKRQADAARLIRDYGVDNIQVLNGRFGAYLTDGKRNARIPKERDPASLTLEECRALLADAPLRGTTRFGRRKAGANAATKAAEKAERAAAKKAATAKPKKKTAKKSAKKKSTAKKKAAQSTRTAE
jgi:DNA topoisomerase-1